MPFIALIQAIGSRLIVGVIALLAVFGLGSVPEHTRPTVENPPAAVQEVEIEETAPTALPEEKEDSEPPAGEVETTPLPATEPQPEETPAPTAPQTPSDIIVDEPVELPLSFSDINTETAKTLVNVLCTQNVAGTVNPITGSGVIIDPRGVVVTNAHVAQYFLLKNYPTEGGLSCILRTGSPAQAMYTAELLYISPTWVSLHAHEIAEEEPKGTGEHDFAFLRITGRTDPQANLQSEFPFVPIDTNDRDVRTGDHVLVAAYPAGFLGGVSIQKDLFSASSIATIGERFTFLRETIDLFSVGGTVVSQGGSSGGAVVSDENKLIGVIVTSTRGDTTAERDLRAITLGHVNRSLFENDSTTIDTLLFGDIALKAKLFNLSTAPTLTNLLITELTK